MNKKGYEKPTMTVVEMLNITQLLAESSEVNANRKGYGKANDDVISTELDNDGNWVWN
jgi:hypothetical protein